MNLKAVGNSGFSDVLGDEWYAGAVTAAAEAGIINGRSEGVLDPRSQVTRQEMDVMLKRAYVFKNGNKELAAGPLNGEDGEEFEPESLMTRAEAAKAIYSLLNN
ncbi:S-layer homology domain-containing protein [Paenibacillus sp. DS2015]|uniref:S-layer homology domain-containing protein n=1 Tax=Paenibacillus sp. DS2015 TaxID=3373917 RepID=UPI003D223B64